MLKLYPAIEPFNHFYLTLAGHDQTSENSGQSPQIYVEQCGNPAGIPVVFLHGGPGSGCKALHRCFFDPQLYHIILFDQRGCGRSRPYGCLQQNTTQNLVQDIEEIRQYLGINKWLVFGGSWGATLALCYAQHHAEQVLGLILRGVFLAREQDINWVYSANGAAKIFPDAWHNLVKDLPLSQHQQPLSIIYQQLNSDNNKVSLAMLVKLQRWEAHLISLQAPPISVENTATKKAKVAAIIQLYYSLNQCFIYKKPLLESIDIIRNIPTKIIHGRYDMVCSIDQAWQLKTQWPEADLTIVEMAGHLANEPKIIDALIKATDDFALHMLG